MATKHVPITVSIKDSSLEVIAKNCGQIPVADAISSRCGMFIDDFADGGIMVPASDVRKIEEFSGKPVNTSRDIVKASEKKAGREDGRAKFSFSLDPAYEIPMAERAREVGLPVEDLMAEIVNVALENNWAYDIKVEGKRRIFTQDQEAELASIVGHSDFTVSDIITACRVRAKRKEKPGKPDGAVCEEAESLLEVI